MTPEDFNRAVATLVGTTQYTLEPLPGGANNRVFRVLANGRSTLLKEYFQHAADQRDRLNAEFSFSTFAWNAGLRCLPQPLACDAPNHLGLYELIDGRALQPNEVSKEYVQQALDFFRELNLHKGEPAAKTLPSGSEACFTTAEHLQCVERRVQRLNQVEESSAAAFIRDELVPAWKSIADRVRSQPEPPPIERCLSPSDFGFHNALLEKTGRLRFIDFEYAGWDDPAKTVCDFFCQPALPVPSDCYPMVVAASGVAPERIAQLLPVYRIKWCCIMLNDFLPVDSQRRRFARRDDDTERRDRQLAKARQALKTLKEQSQ